MIIKNNNIKNNNNKSKKPFSLIQKIIKILV